MYESITCCLLLQSSFSSSRKLCMLCSCSVFPYWYSTLTLHYTPASCPPPPHIRAAPDQNLPQLQQQRLSSTPNLTQVKQQMLVDPSAPHPLCTAQLPWYPFDNRVLLRVEWCLTFDLITPQWLDNGICCPYLKSPPQPKGLLLSLSMNHHQAGDCSVRYEDLAS